MICNAADYWHHLHFAAIVPQKTRTPPKKNSPTKRIYQKTCVPPRPNFNSIHGLCPLNTHSPTKHAKKPQFWVESNNKNTKKKTVLFPKPTRHLPKLSSAGVLGMLQPALAMIFELLHIWSLDNQNQQEARHLHKLLQI